MFSWIPSPKAETQSFECAGFVSGRLNNHNHKTSAAIYDTEDTRAVNFSTLVPKAENGR